MTNEALYLLDRQAIADALYARADAFSTDAGDPVPPRMKDGPTPLPKGGMIEVTNILCEFPSSDIALVESYFVAWPSASAENDAPFGGRCLDRLERRGEGWDIVNSDVVFDWSDFGLRAGPSTRPA